MRDLCAWRRPLSGERRRHDKFRGPVERDLRSTSHQQVRALPRPLTRQERSYAAHAVLAARGQWVTNEKTLLTRAGLRQVDEFIAAARPDPGVMRDVVDRSRVVCSDAMREAVATLALGSIELTSGTSGGPMPAGSAR